MPRLIGAANAIEIILGSDLLTARQALELHIVDFVESPDDLLKRAEFLALELTKIPAAERKLVAQMPAPGKVGQAVCGLPTFGAIEN